LRGIFGGGRVWHSGPEQRDDSSSSPVALRGEDVVEEEEGDDEKQNNSMEAEENQKAEQHDGGDNYDDDDDDDDDDDENWEDIEDDNEGDDDQQDTTMNDAHQQKGLFETSSQQAEKNIDDTKILSREELLELFITLCPPKTNETRSTIGFVGYPNVGKSSTINVLCQAKKVAVAATPGKTKHFQTLNIESNITLCDCPGLVFPNFSATKAEMVCNGVLPIDQLREPVGPITLLCQRIPRAILEGTYGINIIPPREDENPNRPPTAQEFLHAFAYMRGFMKSSFGAPDEQRAARIILKDYVKGKLLYCTPPANVDEKEFNQPVYDDIIEKLRSTKRFKPTAEKPDAPVKQAAPSRGQNANDRGHDKQTVGPRHQMKYINPVDEDFFRQKTVNALSKGKNVFAEYQKNISRSNTDEQGETVTTQSKKHRKGKRTK